MTDHGLNAVVSITSGLVLIGFIVLSYVRHQSARKLQMQGVVWLSAVRMLITHVQRHRGLASGMLSGESVLGVELESIQEQISRDFEHISSGGDWVQSHQGWVSITQHWARLAGNVSSLSAARAIDQHNRLIKNLLVFVDDIAGAHHLRTLPGVRVNIWRELLTLAEFIGQLRAFGTSACASAERREGADLDKLRKNIEEVKSSIIELLDTPRCRNNLTAHNLQNILAVLVYVDKHILMRGPQIAATVYFDEITRTIESLYTQFDRELHSVRRQRRK